MGSAFPAERLALCWPRTQHCGTAQQLPAPTGYSVRGGAAPHGTHPSNLNLSSGKELRSSGPPAGPPDPTSIHGISLDSLKQTANDVKHSGDAPWTTSSVHLSNHPSSKQ
ncbi:hypothetical protein ACCO45_000802 [Purpureocillium lilacinum]|uniref:Uncharacterized protein n=1 Tax=Purpureocillium lilacinum TaxID=33203 RepID=A0ACC4E6F4_PURLI